MGRRELREHIFRMLFRVEFNNADEMKEQEELYFDDLEEATGKDQDYILNKYRAIDEKKVEIDELINTVTQGWKTSRMSIVDLTILRLATYEIKWDEDVPESVAINEAVELAKKYAAEEDSSFVNGLLSSVSKGMTADV